MHLRNYIKLLFILMLTVSVGLFMFSAYALVAGRAMEKEYVSLIKEISIIGDEARIMLANANITTYEGTMLSAKYKVSLYIPNICYNQIDPKKTDEQNNEITLYNTKCREKSVPESTLRPEIDELYKKWIDTKYPLEQKQKEINSRLYTDDSGKGKLDTAILDTFTKMAGIGTAISVLVLILIYRIPETASERKDEHPKHK